MENWPGDWRQRALFTELLSLYMGMDKNELEFQALEEQAPGVETFLI